MFLLSRPLFSSSIQEKKMISGVPSLVMPFKYYLQNCFIFIFSLKATVTAELSVAVSKDGN